MSTSRISLADLSRQSGVTLGKFDNASIGNAMAGFDTQGISGHVHPTVADISECLFFSPGDGRIWLQDQRMVLMHTEALGSLRRELIESIGLDKARGLLTRAGYVSGARDALLVRKQWPDADPSAAAIAGTRLHALEGVVKVEVVHASYDAETGNYEGEFLWHNSSEDDEHIAAYGIGGSPACWMQVGYATGYVSTLFGRLIVFREVNCRSVGDAHCRVIGKSAEQWDDLEEDMQYLNAQSFVDTAAYARSAFKETGNDRRKTRSAADLSVDLLAQASAGQAMVGASSAFNAACHMLQRVAPTTATVLFTGESGVGKEKFASMLHQVSLRQNKPFIAINCAAIPETLMESELFGVERGAYTGAGQSRAGRFERANGGTLFLDEVATLSFVAQGKLLRALQEGEIERVGGTRSIQVDVRVVAATNVDLRRAVGDGTFREDLFFRLNVFPIHLPPLRDRRDDIPLLMSHFLSHYNKKHSRSVAGFSQSAIKALFNYGFPGNIRELQNLVERGVILVLDNGLIDMHHLFSSGEALPRDVLSLQMEGDAGILSSAVIVDGSHVETQTLTKPMVSMTAAPLPTLGQRSLDQAEKTLLRQAITQTGGNLAAAARILGISRATLAYRAKRSGLIPKAQRRTVI